MCVLSFSFRTDELLLIVKPKRSNPIDAAVCGQSPSQVDIDEATAGMPLIKQYPNEMALDHVKIIDVHEHATMLIIWLTDSFSFASIRSIGPSSISSTMRPNSRRLCSAKDRWPKV